MSLGVDLVPKKVCTLDCVYCEVGKTTKLTTEREEYIRYNKVIEELDWFFHSSNPDPDYITFSGSGEPTLNSRLEDILRFIKEKKPHIPIAVLTNGTLLYQKDVRKSLMEADVVLPSLDAGSDEVFRAINRPEKSLNMEEIIQGLALFREEFRGELWLELFILPGYNDYPEELLLIKKALSKIQPHKVQLNTLDRPGTVENLTRASQVELERIAAFLDGFNTEIIADPPRRQTIQSYRSDRENAIMGTLIRRPCTLEDLSRILGIHINEINKYLAVLETEEKIEAVRQERGLFYQSKNK
jgi:wyosine [tRNA(Phe)-imidazoG37] synthetase (radical SAM superfamily)